MKIIIIKGKQNFIFSLLIFFLMRSLISSIENGLLFLELTCFYQQSISMTINNLRQDRKSIIAYKMKWCTMPTSIHKTKAVYTFAFIFHQRKLIQRYISIYHRLLPPSRKINYWFCYFTLNLFFLQKNTIQKGEGK